MGNDLDRIKKPVGKVLDTAIDIAIDVSVNTLGLMVNKFDDYSVPEETVAIDERLLKKEELILAIRKDPGNEELHYQMARLHEKAFEFTSAKVEYEIAQLLGGLDDKQIAQYKHLLWKLGQPDKI